MPYEWLSNRGTDALERKKATALPQNGFVPSNKAIAQLVARRGCEVPDEVTAGTSLPHLAPGLGNRATSQQRKPTLARTRERAVAIAKPRVLEGFQDAPVGTPSRRGSLDSDEGFEDAPVGTPSRRGSIEEEFYKALEEQEESESTSQEEPPVGAAPPQDEQTYFGYLWAGFTSAVQRAGAAASEAIYGEGEALEDIGDIYERERKSRAPSAGAAARATARATETAAALQQGGAGSWASPSAGERRGPAVIGATRGAAPKAAQASSPVEETWGQWGKKWAGAGVAWIGNGIAALAVQYPNAAKEVVAFLAPVAKYLPATWQGQITSYLRDYLSKSFGVRTLHDPSGKEIGDAELIAGLVQGLGITAKALNVWEDDMLVLDTPALSIPATELKGGAESVLLQGNIKGLKFLIPFKKTIDGLQRGNLADLQFAFQFGELDISVSLPHLNSWVHLSAKNLSADISRRTVNAPAKAISAIGQAILAAGASGATPSLVLALEDLGISAQSIQLNTGIQKSAEEFVKPSIELSGMEFSHPAPGQTRLKVNVGLTLSQITGDERTLNIRDLTILLDEKGTGSVEAVFNVNRKVLSLIKGFRGAVVRALGNLILHPHEEIKVKVPFSGYEAILNKVVVEWPRHPILRWLVNTLIANLRVDETQRKLKLAFFTLAEHQMFSKPAAGQAAINLIELIRTLPPIDIPKLH